MGCSVFVEHEHVTATQLFEDRRSLMTFLDRYQRLPVVTADWREEDIEAARRLIEQQQAALSEAEERFMEIVERPYVDSELESLLQTYAKRAEDWLTNHGKGE
jgi:Lon protease-like protein